MQTFNNIQPGQSVLVSEDFPPLLDGKNVCTMRWSAQCGDETLTGESEICVEADAPIGLCTSGPNGIGKLHGASTHMYTLANMKNWTNGLLAIPFTNKNHTFIDSIRVHTTSRTSSYYNGNGGTFKFHIYTDNGGVPGNLIASTPDYIGATSLTSTGGPWSSQAQAQSTYPNAIWSSYNETGNDLVFHRRYNLTSPLAVQPCTRYWIVMERTTSTAHGTSLNGMFQGSSPKDDDPCFNDGDWKIRVFRNGGWDQLAHRGVFEVLGDGLNIGQAQHEVSAFTDADKTNNVNGTSAARQCWVPDKTMEVGQIRVQAGRRSGSAPLQYRIKNSSGTTLAAGNLTGYPVVTTNDAREAMRRMSRESSLFNKITVVAGQTYYIELYTTSGTHYDIGMTRDGVLSDHYTVDQKCHSWGPNSRAEVSYNNGGSWVLPTNWNNPRDYLALEGDIGECADGISTCLENCCECIFT